MASARLERLRKLVQADVDALPDRPVSPHSGSDDEGSGGVSLEPDLPRPISPSNKQIVSNETDSSIKPAPEPITTDDDSERRFLWLKDAKSSYNPKPLSMPPTSPPEAPNLPSTTRQRGDLASFRQDFTPIQALAKYPYKFCNKSNSQDIASAFFDQGKFWDREWDLYYVWDPEDDTKPLILVRETQLQTLLQEINTHLKLRLRITDQQREESFVTHFPDHPSCQPRYLGRSHSREEYDNMVQNAPNAAFRSAGESNHPPLERTTLEEFRQLMQDLRDVQKAKNKASKAKKQQDRLNKQLSMADQFKRTQRYLGLRSSLGEGRMPANVPTPIDPTSLTPFAFDQDVVFVCVDVESYERAHHKITEVGVATLDTRDLVGVVPGFDGEEWRNHIRARHFRINEYKHLVNSDFVSGYPDKFRFGESTFVPLEDAAQHVASCFHAPFGAHHSNSAEAISTLMVNIDLNEKRNIIFLGHDTLGDVRYLQQLGYDPMKVENIVEALDTAVMFRVWRREQQATSLTKILSSFDMDGFYAHNAGNDAVFTVQAMLAICVREATIRGSPELDHFRTEEQVARLSAAVEEARERVANEEQGWSNTDTEGNGGDPVPLANSDLPKFPPATSASRGTAQHGGFLDSGGRGQRGLTYGSAGDRHDDDHDGGLNGHRGGTDRGSQQGVHRSTGRGHTQGRGGSEDHGRGRGRGRGRGQLFDPTVRSWSPNAPAEPQVYYHW